MRRDLLRQFATYDLPVPVLDPGFLLTVSRTQRRAQQMTWTPLTADELPLVVRKGALCAIDAEFVARREEENEIRPDGSRALLRPSRLALARVSVVRGEVCGGWPKPPAQAGAQGLTWVSAPFWFHDGVQPLRVRCKGCRLLTTTFK